MLFPQFRSNAKEYEESRKRWQSAFNSVVPEATKPKWKDWLTDKFHDGTAIFSRRSDKIRKGIVINQVLPEDDSLVFRAWMGTFGSKEYGDEIERLTIQCMLTDASIRNAKTLIKALIVDRLPYQEMEKRCVDATHASEEIDA